MRLIFDSSMLFYIGGAALLVPMVVLVRTLFVHTDVAGNESASQNRTIAIRQRRQRKSRFATTLRLISYPTDLFKQVASDRAAWMTTRFSGVRNEEPYALSRRVGVAVLGPRPKLQSISGETPPRG